MASPERFLVLSLTGGILQAIACGYVIGQGCTYLTLVQPERIFKILVLWVMSLQIIYCILYNIDTIVKFANKFGDFTGQLEVNAPISIAMYINAMTLLTVQGFFAWRAFVVWSRSLVVLPLCSLAALAGGITLFHFGIFMQLDGSFPRGFARLGWRSGLSLIIPASCDIIITSILLAGLYRAHSAGASDVSRKIFARIIRLALESNGITAIYHIICLVLNYGTDSGQVVLTAALPQIYSITLILWLLARVKTRQILSGSREGPSTNSNVLPSKIHPSAIHVQTTRSMHFDNESAGNSTSYNMELEDFENEKHSEKLQINVA